MTVTARRKFNHDWNFGVNWVVAALFWMVSSLKKMSRHVLNEHERLRERECQRGNIRELEMITLIVDGEDLPKFAGNIDRADQPVKALFVFNRDTKNVHIDQLEAWYVTLIKIDYNARFAHETMQSGQGGINWRTSCRHNWRNNWW